MKKWMIFLCILAVAAFLRLWQLGMVPPSPDWDEAALGYNAYSILKTGKDEYGMSLPLSLRSFDDYKPPLYMYTVIPPVALFGMDTWVVRLPSALFGIATVAATYFLTNAVFESANYGTKRKREILALIAMGLLALSPWHIQFSRIAFEANLGLTLNVFGLLLFFLGLASPWLWSGTALFFGLGLYAYQSERVFVPLLFVLLGILFWKRVWSAKKQLVVALVVGILTVAPLVPVLMNGKNLSRLQGTSSLADQTALLFRSVAKLEEDARAHDPLGVVFDNRRLVWFRTVTAGYLSHFSFRWLFVTGDNPRHHAPDMGLLYLVELPFLLYGLYVVWRTKGLLAKVLFGWILIAPVAAAPTTGVPHAIRTLVVLPSLQIVTAIGIYEFFFRYPGLDPGSRKQNLDSGSWAGMTAQRKLFCCFVVLVALLNVGYYLHMYFNHLNTEVSQHWQYGYKQAVTYAEAHKAKYDHVVVSTKLEQPYMFFLFFSKYDPTTYQAEGGTASGGFAEYGNKFGKYIFRPIDWDKEVKDGKTLYIGTPKEIPSANIQTINYLDGTEAMRIADR